jgi:hypothetical protein
VRCRVTVIMQRTCDFIHRESAQHMPLSVQLQLLSVLQVWTEGLERVHVRAPSILGDFKPAAVMSSTHPDMSLKPCVFSLRCSTHGTSRLLECRESRYFGHALSPVRALDTSQVARPALV